MDKGLRGEQHISNQLLSELAVYWLAFYNHPADQEQDVLTE